MEKLNEIVEAKEQIEATEKQAAEKEALQIQLEEAIATGNQSHINYYTARIKEMDSNRISESINDEKIGSTSMANMYREQAAKAAIELGKTSRTYRDLLVKAELEEMKD